MLCVTGKMLEDALAVGVGGLVFLFLTCAFIYALKAQEVEIKILARTSSCTDWLLCCVTGKTLVGWGGG